MTQKPTGVFVRLPLSEEQAHSYLRESSAAWDECNGSSDAIACESGLLAIGTLVTGTELYPIGYINEDVIRGLATGVYQSASIFRDEDKEHHDTIALVRLSDAQAQLAARDAEIVRLREENERLNRQIRPQFFCSDILEESSMDTREGIVAEARDCDDDLQAFTIFEMEGYAKVHKSYGFYDQSNKCHWFDTEAEALSAVAGLKGGAA